MCPYCFPIPVCLKVVPGFFSPQQKQNSAEKNCSKTGSLDLRWSKQLLRSLSLEFFFFFWGIWYCLKVRAPRFVFRDLVLAYLSVTLTSVKARGNCQHFSCCAPLFLSTWSTGKYLVLGWKEAAISSGMERGEREGETGSATYIQWSWMGQNWPECCSLQAPCPHRAERQNPLLHG